MILIHSGSMAPRPPYAPGETQAAKITTLTTSQNLSIFVRIGIILTKPPQSLLPPAPSSLLSGYREGGLVICSTPVLSKGVLSL